MTEKFCQDWGQGPHKLKLGKSFEPTKKGASGAPAYNRLFSKSQTPSHFSPSPVSDMTSSPHLLIKRAWAL